MIRRFVGGVVLCGWLAASAFAGTDAEAKQHFDEGTKAFNLGELDHAVEEFKAAYKARPDAILLYNIAQAYRLASNLPQALFFYKSYLHNHPGADNRQEVADRIQNLEAELQAQRALATQPPNSVTPAPPVEQVPAPPVPIASPAPSSVVASKTKDAPKHVPTYKKWWLWTTVGGVVVVGVSLGVGLGLGLRSPSAKEVF